MNRKVAVVAGVGPGLGAAPARKFLREDCRVGMLARSHVSDAEAVKNAFQEIEADLGPVSILGNHASVASWKRIMDSTPVEFETAWRVSVLGAFHCSRAVIPGMLSAGSGTILFTGATSSNDPLHGSHLFDSGRKGSVGFSSAKFGSRGLADSMARELWPKGIHVTHVIIDGLIDTPRVRSEFEPEDGEPMLDPESMAESYWHLVAQDRSSWIGLGQCV